MSRGKHRSERTKLQRSLPGLQLERLESRTVFAAEGLSLGLVQPMNAIQLSPVMELVDARLWSGGALRARATAAVRLDAMVAMRPEATVMFRPELSEVTAVRLLPSLRDFAFSDRVDIDTIAISWRDLMFGDGTNTISRGDAGPSGELDNGGDRTDYPTSGSDSVSDPLITPPAMSNGGAKPVDRTSWLISQSLDLEGELLYEQENATSSSSANDDRQDQQASSAAVERVWNALTVVPDAAGELHFDKIDTDVENAGADVAEESLLQDGTVVEQKEATSQIGTEWWESSGEKSLRSADASGNLAWRDISFETYATGRQVSESYEEGGLADVANASSDVRLLVSSDSPQLRRTLPVLGGVTDANDILQGLPQEWNSELVADAVANDDAASTFNSYLGSLIVATATGVGILIERRRRARNNDDILPQQRDNT